MKYLVLATTDDQIHESPFIVVGHDNPNLIGSHWELKGTIGQIAIQEGGKTYTGTTAVDAYSKMWRELINSFNNAIADDWEYEEEVKMIEDFCSFLETKGYMTSYPAELDWATGII